MRLLPQFVAMLLVLHTTAGCCAHHAHRLADQSGQGDSTVAERSHVQDHLHLAADRVQTSSGLDACCAMQHADDHDLSVCMGNRCTFVRMESSPGGLEATAPLLVGALGFSQLGFVQNVSASRDTRFRSETQFVSEPRHLVLSVMLL